jgi:hypothetical protein
LFHFLSERGSRILLEFTLRTLNYPKAGVG